MKKKLIPIALIAAVAGASTYWYQHQAEGDNVLSYVPSDTPFFTGQLTPFPIKDYVASAPKLIDSQEPTHIEVLNGEESPSIDFLMSLLSTYEDSLKDPDLLTSNFGLADEIRAYMYTLGLLPVVKVEVANPQAIWNLLDKNEQETGFSHTEGELQGLKYRIYPMVEDDQGDPINLIIAQSNGMLTATIQSSFVSENLLAMALGLKKPSKSLGDTHILEEMMQQHRLTNNSVGFVNHVEIIKGLTSEDDNQLARQLTEIAKEEDTIFQLLHSPACKEELRSIAQNWPRTAFGYTQVDINKEQSTLSFAAVLESKNQPILNALKTLRGYIPNYTQNFDDNVIATSIGLDVGQLSSALTDIWANLKTPRFQCEPLADIQYQIDANGQSIAIVGIGSSMAANVKGISSAIFDYSVSQDNDHPHLESLDALLAVHVKNPVSLFNSLKTFVPELQQIDLIDNGPAVSLNKITPILSQLNLDPKMAIKGDHFVIYNGNKGLQEAEKLSLETLSAEGLYQLSFDTKKILTPIASAVELAGEIIPKEAMFLKDYDTRMNINVDINDQGIRLDSTMNHKAAEK